MHVYARTCNYVTAALLSSPSSAVTGTGRPQPELRGSLNDKDSCVIGEPPPCFEPYCRETTNAEAEQMELLFPRHRASG